MITLQKRLQDQIEKTARTIHADSYSISIGELINMYESGEIDVHPEFQRAFRWNIEQKSALIESILLGIPIPPIFVFMREDGVWDVIDGQQRLSTIFQFAGKYNNSSGKIDPPLELVKTKFLTLLDKIVWENEDEAVPQLDIPQRLRIKRGKIDVKIIKATSDKNAKYDLFQRLNSGGTRLTEQEIRICIIIMEGEDFYDELLKMSQNEDFMSCLPLTERAINEQEHLEYIVRFIVSRHGQLEDMGQGLHEYLTESIIKIMKDSEFSIAKEKKEFDRFFEYLNNCMGEDSFKRYNVKKDAFQGPTTISAFEAIVPAVSKRLDYYQGKVNEVQFREKLIQMHSNEQYKKASQRATTGRYKLLLNFGEEFFGNNAEN